MGEDSGSLGIREMEDGERIGEMKPVGQKLGGGKARSLYGEPGSPV